MRTSNPMLKKEAFRKEGASASAMTILIQDHHYE